MLGLCAEGTLSHVPRYYALVSTVCTCIALTINVLSATCMHVLRPAFVFVLFLCCIVFQWSVVQNFSALAVIRPSPICLKAPLLWEGRGGSLDFVWLLLFLETVFVRLVHFFNAFVLLW